jgi:hypothetical protein
MNIFKKYKINRIIKKLNSYNVDIYSGGDGFGTRDNIYFFSKFGDFYRLRDEKSWFDPRITFNKKQLFHFIFQIQTRKIIIYHRS